LLSEIIHDLKEAMSIGIHTVFKVHHSLILWIDKNTKEYMPREIESNSDLSAKISPQQRVLSLHCTCSYKKSSCLH